MMGTAGGVFSPGSAHNAYIAKISNMEIMDLIALHTPYSLVLWVVGIVGIFVMAIIFKDKGEATDNIQVNIEHKQEEIVRPNVIFALVPLLPIVILVLGNTVVPQIKMGVAQAMVLGAIFCLAHHPRQPARLSPRRSLTAWVRATATSWVSSSPPRVFAAGLRACRFDRHVHCLVA